MIFNKNTKVWRYMSYARFVWLLQTRMLWYSRADLLGDPWEISLAGDQLAHVISIAPISQIGELPRESTIQRAERIIKMWRMQTFVNCWRASDHESHALWQIYCPSSEGVAIQTTHGKLEESIGKLHPVTYETPGTRKKTPQREDLVTHKRPMFEYEQEVRSYFFVDSEPLDSTVLGRGIKWDFDIYLEAIYVHPVADRSFLDTVATTVETYAPSLKDKVIWSAMTVQPPF